MQWHEHAESDELSAKDVEAAAKELQALQAGYEAEVAEAELLADQMEQLVEQVDQARAEAAQHEQAAEAVRQRVRREKMRNVSALKKYGHLSSHPADAAHTLRVARAQKPVPRSSNGHTRGA